MRFFPLATTLFSNSVQSHGPADLMELKGKIDGESEYSCSWFGVEEGNLGIFREEKQHTVGKFHPNKKERKERNLNLFRKDAGFFALPNFLALWSPLPAA
jgi:hypothetical protein